MNGVAVTARHPPASATVTAPHPPRAARAPRMATASSEEPMVPDMNKRNTMNLLLAGAATTVALAALGPYTYFFVPKSAGGTGGGLAARDAAGSVLKAQPYLASHAAGSRELVLGLQGEATWLIVDTDKALEPFALNAVCTHLGCVVPWVPAENKFKCPCHGSQYDRNGKVIRGPAPLSLALEHVDVSGDGEIVLSSWKDEDFRTGEMPWWKF
ncbi:hypothetical protein BU14_0234s0022 [Porphyra umbilicalis]|uniref:plastoquinol--plastocyanin reductase n=1 Tax=Porphyra umbilicalis TaxID=2786 RepID=A0A1X6P412_PORUM|nr:hypothetical protein BU14_0234s0022 [Porphyra umbilicalis]|eukprot:OSX75495.1 hypothetical protein BU14_0234s0022 [Porphyra umbilicalis]